MTVQLQYMPPGGATQTLSLSFGVDAPYKLISARSQQDFGIDGTQENYCDWNNPAGNQGYRSLIYYAAMSTFGKLMPRIYEHEELSAWNPVYVGNDWPNGTPEGGQINLSIIDNICQIHPNRAPPSLPPGQPPPPVEIKNTTQTWFVGSNDQGQGIEVQSDTLHVFQDHGSHTNIQSPVR